MNHLSGIRSLPALLGVVLSSACVTTDAPALPAYLTAGNSADSALVWSGIEVCRGERGDVAIATTTHEAAIENYNRNATRIAIRGVQLGPSDELSCGPLDFGAAITHSDGGLTTFLNDAAVPCVSSTGISLVVSGFSGSAIELRRGAQGFDRTLKFSVHIATSQDAGVADEAFITCSFEMHALH